jgi:hypothetical protein
MEMQLLTDVADVLDAPPDSFASFTSRPTGRDESWAHSVISMAGPQQPMPSLRGDDTFTAVNASVAPRGGASLQHQQQQQQYSAEAPRDEYSYLTTFGDEDPLGAPLDGDEPLADPLSAEIAQRHAVVVADAALLRERAELVHHLRQREAEQIVEALALLDDERRVRQARCNALQAEARQMSQKKIDILAKHLDVTAKREAANAAAFLQENGSQGEGSQRGGTLPAASASGRDAPAGAASVVDLEINKKVLRRQPLPRGFSAGALTKHSASEHYAQYWRRQSSFEN